MKRVMLHRALAPGSAAPPFVYGYILTDLFGAYKSHGDWALIHLPTGAAVVWAKTLRETKRLVVDLTFDFRDVFTGIKTLTGFRRKLAKLSPERLAAYRRLVPPLRGVA